MTLYGKTVKKCGCLRCNGDVILDHSVQLLIFPPLYKGQCNKCNEISYHDLTGEKNDAQKHPRGLLERGSAWD